MPIIICGISFLHISAFSSVSLREIVRHLLSREAAVALRATDPQRLCLNRNKLAFPEKRANVSTVAVDLSGRKGKKRKKKKKKEKPSLLRYAASASSCQAGLDFLALASVVIFHRSELTSCARTHVPARLIIRRAVVVHLPQNVSPRTAAGITTSSNAGIYDLTKAPRDAFMRRGRKSAHDDSPSHSLCQEKEGMDERALQINARFVAFY